jgi:integrase
MKKTTFTPVFNKKKKLDKGGRGAVHIYCYLGGQKTYVPTGIKLLPSEWDGRRVTDVNDNHMRLNYLIKEKVRELEKAELQMLSDRGSFSLADIKGIDNEGYKSFTAFLSDEVKKDNTVSPGTRKYRNALVRRFRAAIGDITFVRLGYDTLQDFEDYMIREKLAIGTRRTQHNQLRKFIGIAVNKGYMKRNPYKLFKIKKPPFALKKVLWYDELDRLWNLKYNDGYEVVRLKFLFSCYVGLRISDASNIKRSDIRDGKIFLTMQKTNLPLVVPLTIISDRGQVIFKICSDKDREHIFEKFSDQDTNKKLKKIGIDADISFPLTFHMARHTFCTLVAHKTGSVFEVMRYAGLYNVENTMTYVNLAKLYSQ